MDARAPVGAVRFARIVTGESHVPDALAPPPGNPRFPLADSIRALAALSVLVFHTALVSGAAGEEWPGRLLGQLNVGVTVFFVLSGFLLYRPYAAARRGGPPAPRLVDYARRRALRILPAYWLALSVLLLWPGLTTRGDVWVLYALQQTNPLATDPVPCLAAGGCGIPQAWSLSTEAFFYAALPLLALALPGRARSDLARLATLAAASLVFLGFAITAYPEHPGIYLMHLGLAGTFLWFGLGMGLAVLSAEADGHGEGDGGAPLRLLRDHPWLAWLGALLAFVACAALPTDAVETTGSSLRHVARHVLLGTVAVLLVAPAVLGHRGGGWPRRMLSWRPLAWVGLVSYGVFLWHYAVAGELFDSQELGFAALTALTLPISLALAAGSYYALERPLLRLKHRGARGPLRPAPGERVHERPEVARQPDQGGDGEAVADRHEDGHDRADHGHDPVHPPRPGHPGGVERGEPPQADRQGRAEHDPERSEHRDRHDEAGGERQVDQGAQERP